MAGLLSWAVECRSALISLSLAKSISRVYSTTNRSSYSYYSKRQWVRMSRLTVHQLIVHRRSAATASLHGRSKVEVQVAQDLREGLHRPFWHPPPWPLFDAQGVNVVSPLFPQRHFSSNTAKPVQINPVRRRERRAGNFISQHDAN